MSRGFLRSERLLERMVLAHPTSIDLLGATWGNFDASKMTNELFNTSDEAAQGGCMRWH